MVRINKNEKWNYTNAKDVYSPDMWANFCGGYTAIGLNNKWNYVGKNGKYLPDEWVDDYNSFHGDYAKIGCNGKLEKIDMRGEVINEGTHRNRIYSSIFY